MDLYYSSGASRGVVELDPSGTIGDLREAIALAVGIPAGQLMLRIGESVLRDNLETLADAGVCPESTIGVDRSVRKGLFAGGLCHTIAILSDKTVATWGGGSYKQSVIPPSVKGVSCDAVAASTSNSMVLRSDGAVFVWGWASNGQTEVPDFGGRPVSQIGMAYTSAFALLHDGDFVHWGGLLSQRAPSLEKGRVADIAIGQESAAVLLNDGSVLAWNTDRGGEATVRVEAGKRVRKVASVLKGGIALMEDGPPVHWGIDEVQWDAKLCAAAADAVDVTGSLELITFMYPGGRARTFRNLHSQNANLEEQTLKETQSPVIMIGSGVRHTLRGLADGTLMGDGYGPDKQLPETAPGSLW
eukprot:Hpha_TRINITY_DN1028_c0_g1::TRINITY_DN1028_c0_g1_i1::g.84828::m.84828